MLTTLPLIIGNFLSYFICSPLYLLTIGNTWHYSYLEYYFDFLIIIPSLSHSASQMIVLQSEPLGYSPAIPDLVVMIVAVCQSMWESCFIYLFIISLPNIIYERQTYRYIVLLILLKDYLRTREMQSCEHSAEHEYNNDVEFQTFKRRLYDTSPSNDKTCCLPLPGCSLLPCYLQFCFLYCQLPKASPTFWYC